MIDLLMQGTSLIGAGLILGAFVALQRGWWASHDARYLWANFVGASLLTVVATWDRRIGFMVLEIAWAAVALASLLRRNPASR